MFRDSNTASGYKGIGVTSRPIGKRSRSYNAKASALPHDQVAKGPEVSFVSIYERNREPQFKKKLYNFLSNYFSFAASC